MITPNPTPYADLSPDLVLTAIESLGLPTDGRMLALNSYENRVYQIGIEDAQPLIAKFYRPGRWSDAAILEEHAFTRTLAEHEIPAVPPSIIDGRTLHAYAGHRFSLTPRRGGRTPELDDPSVLEWLGRLLGRIHAIGALEPFAHRPTLDIASFGEEPRAFLLEHDWIPKDLLPAYEQRRRAGARRRARLLRARRLAGLDPAARRLSSRQHALDGRRTALRRLRRRTHGPGHPGSLDAALG
jgi:Ser/Thr protein kinase RdoA (MazF antagonist)